MADVELEHREVDARVAGPHLFVGKAGVAQHGRPGLLEVGGVGAVVDDAHGVRLGEAGPQMVDEPVRRRVERWAGG